MTLYPSSWEHRNLLQIQRWIGLLLLLQTFIHAQVVTEDVSSTTETLQKPWEADWRLPGDTNPMSYKLRIEPQVEEGTFKGCVEILYTNTNAKDHVILHAVDLNISRIQVSTESVSRMDQEESVENNVEVAEWFPYVKHEFLVVKYNCSIEPNVPVKLSIDFDGSLLSGKLNGFYRSQYTHKGKTKYLATTKFEPNYARRAFPCFDEPGMKATFDIEIVKPTKELSALSNTMEESEVYRNDTDDYLVTFKSLSPVPTYTICFITSEFKIVERETTNLGVEVRGLARDGHEGSMKYATVMTKRSVEYFEDYLGLKYPLSKLDIIGIPDFSSGAMENFGLITFKETNVMINPKTSGYMDYFAVVNVVCHEVAHMWFGNLITMKWWNDIWLNEGFATYFSMKCTKALQPELNADELGYVKKKLSALVSDTPLNSHPIINNVSHNDQLSGVFNEIAYRKGHSMLEMLEDYLGEDKFREALQLYVAQYENLNSDTAALVATMEFISGLPLIAMMEDWTTQPGYPLISVEKFGPHLYLTQKRFTYSRGDKRQSLSRFRWDTPITFRISSEPDTKRIYFNKENHSAIIELDDESNWFKINIGGVGFYRVNYPEDVWKSYQELLFTDSQIFSDWSDRANLLDDACNLASTGHIKYETSLSLFSYLVEGNETNYAPWRVASKCLNDIKKRLPSSGKTNQMFVHYVKSIIDKSITSTLETLNQTKSSPFDFNPANEVIFSLGCAFKHPDAIERAKILFEQWLNEGEDIDPDIRPIIFRYGISGDEEVRKWEKVWEKYSQVDDPHELRDLRVALISVKSTNLLKRLVQMSKNESLVRTQDYYGILTTMANKKKTNDIVWDLFRNEYDHLEDKFSRGKLSKLFQTVASNFYTRTKLKEVKDFLKVHPNVIPEKRDQKKVEENIGNNMKWREMHEKDLRIWLHKRI